VSTLTDKPDADAQHDPYSNPTARALIRQEESSAGQTGVDEGIKKLEDYANDPANSSRNIDDVARREAANNVFNYDKSADTPKPSLRNFTFKGALRKKGPLGFLIGILLGGIGGLSLLISPSMAIVQLKEILTDDLNDQLAAMDTRTTHVFRAKLNDMGTGVCRGIQIKCGYKGFSDRQLKRFRAAGIEVETAGKSNIPPFRHKVKSLTFKQTVGLETRVIKVNNPAELNRLLGERIVRNGLRKAFNPKFAGFQDAVSEKVFGKFRTSKADKLGTGSTDDMDKSIDDSVAGELDDGSITTQTDNKKNEDGSPVDEDADAKNAEAQAQADRLQNGAGDLDSVFESTAKNGIKGALKGVLITGALDSLCTVKNTARAVAAAAKAQRQIQLARYAMIFLTAADQIKAGTITPEQAEHIGNTLTAIDSRETVVNETSIVGNDGDTPEPVKNPDYGKNAFDSDGYKVAMYNDAPTLSANSMQYAVGGSALMGTLSSVNNLIETKVGGSKCKYIQNNVVRLGSLIVGIGVGAITLGASTAISIGASIAVSMALPILENYLANILAGKVVSSATEGVDSGNAIFAGTAALMGNMAMGRGMKPATKSDLKTYLALNDEVQAEYIAMETEEAKDTPFDAMNRYSFLGSLTRSFLPLRTNSSSTVGGAALNIFSLFSSVSSSLSNTAGAQNEYNEARYSKCKDYGYEDLGIDADVFCNVRYVLSPEELALDTDYVIDWMASNDFIDAESGNPQSKYVDWLDDCTNRTDGWGETSVENGPTGADCMNSSDTSEGGTYSDTELKYFRVYTMDKSIFDAMDYEPPVGTGSDITNTGAGVTFTLGSYNMPTDKGVAGRDTAIRNITNQEGGLDVVGMQEQVRENYAYMQRNLKQRGYGVYPDYKPGTYGRRPCSSSQLITYNKEKFNFKKAEIFAYPRYPDPATSCDGEKTKAGHSNAPIVWLEAVDGGQTIIVINIHNAANVPVAGNTNPSLIRFQAAKLYVDQITRLQKENPGIPIFLTGDFNEGTGVRTSGNRTYNGDVNNLLFCMFAKNKLMKSVGGPKMTCGGHGIGGVDYIYARPDVKVESFRELPRAQSGSDHPFIYSKLTVPAGETGSTTGSDIVGDDYRRECNRYLSAADCEGECVGFVKFRLVKHGVISPASLGDGGSVTSTLGRPPYNFTVNQTPAVHAVFSTSKTSSPSVGHTGIVSAVKPDGSIVIEEYNWDVDYGYGTRTLTKQQYQSAGFTFAHTETKYK
jgi:surface antigen